MKRLLTGQHGCNDFDRQSVLYLSGDVNNSRVHLQSGQILVSSRTLKWFADHWPDFVRVYKRALVNPSYATQLCLASNQRLPSYLLMSNQVQLAISRRQLPLVCQQLGTIKLQISRLLRSN